MKNRLKSYFVIIGLILFPIVALAKPSIPDEYTLHFKENGVLSVCSYSEFKPVSYGDAQGYEADLLRAIARLWHVKIKFYPENIYEGIWRLPSRQYTHCDIAIGGITPTKARIKENATFSKKTTLFKQSLLVRKEDYESGRITSYFSFKNTHMNIGVVPGTTGEQYAHIIAKNAGLPLSVFIQYTSESELLPALISGKISAIARGEIGNKYQASLNKNLVSIAETDFHEGFSFAVDSSNKKLLSNLNQTIIVLSDNGKITYWQWLNNHDIFIEHANKLLDNKIKMRFSEKLA